jgi:hypothetical protein
MFEFTKRKYSGGEDVWWDRVQIGRIQLNIAENPNVDWKALRADKTLRLPHNERWNYTFTAHLTNGSIVGIYEEKFEAASAVLAKHREIYLKSIQGETGYEQR